MSEPTARSERLQPAPSVALPKPTAISPLPFPALTLHRRNAPTEPLHCIYSLGLAVVAQGSKQVPCSGTR